MSEQAEEISAFLGRLKEKPVLDQLSSHLQMSGSEIEEKIEFLQSRVSSPSSADSEKFFLYVDGAARNNPGPAGGGAVIYDEKEEKIEEDCSYFGSCLTNNAAEYRALLLGLELLPEDCRKLKVHMDSELIIKQLQGEYAVNSTNLRPYFEQVESALDKFDQVEFEAIPREKNKKADSLANRAIDEQA